MSHSSDFSEANGHSSRPSGQGVVLPSIRHLLAEVDGTDRTSQSHSHAGHSAYNSHDAIPRTDVWHYSHSHRSLLEFAHPIPHGAWRVLFQPESGSLPGIAMSELLLGRGVLDPLARPFEAYGVDSITVRIRFSEYETSIAEINVRNQTRQQIATDVARAHERVIQRGLNYNINALRLKGMFFDPSNGLWQPVVTTVVPSG